MKQEAERRELWVRAFLLSYETCRAARLLSGDDAELGSLEELDDVSDLGAVGHLVDNLVDGVEERRTAVEDQTVSVGNVLQNLFIDSMLAAYGKVDTAIGVLLRGDDIRRYVARESGACLYHGALSDACLGVLDNGTGEDDAVLNQAVAGNLSAVAEDAVVANLGVVADVGTLHEHVLVADDGLAAGMCGTVDDNVFADDVAIADDALRLLATELEVLWQGTDDGTLMHLVALAHACAAADADEGEDDAVVAYLHVVLNINEGEYLTVVADFCFGADFGLG